MATKKETVVNEKIIEAVNEAMVSEATGKKWYYSKTFWANIVAGVFSNSTYILCLCSSCRISNAFNGCY